MNESQVIIALSALSQETRLRILRYLVTRGEAGAAAGEIGTAVAASSSRCSFHLSALAGAGLIVSVRRSRSIIYRVDFAAVGAMIGYLVRDCCNSNAHVLACCTDAECC
jgi:DNA-binding transcriptional ArsR family regulator